MVLTLTERPKLLYIGKDKQKLHMGEEAGQSGGIAVKWPLISLWLCNINLFPKYLKIYIIYLVFKIDILHISLAPKLIKWYMMLN